MAFTIPENLHPDLMPLAWLVGTWRGKGRGEYPNVPGFQFAQEVSFNHDGRAFLNYFSRYIFVVLLNFIRFLYLFVNRIYELQRNCHPRFVLFANPS